VPSIVAIGWCASLARCWGGLMVAGAWPQQLRQSLGTHESAEQMMP